MRWIFSRAAKALPDRQLHEIKNLCKILFIDDQDFRVVEILKDSGWINTKLIKDVSSLDEADLSEAHIIFVDILGVGARLGFSDEGLGLISALRNKYPSKSIVVYSAESQGDRFHKGLSQADSRLRKNADPYEFQILVERYSRGAFSRNEYLARIQEMIRKESGVLLEVKDIEKKLLKLSRREPIDEDLLRRTFNIRNAFTMLEIIRVFMSH